MYIENLIGDLLLRNNCVIIPSFGGFLSKQVSASIDYQTGMMLPPGRMISFNRQLINNDGLLIASYAQQASVSYEQAHFDIQDQVDQWWLRLNNGERISIEKIGYLFLDQEKNIGFEQDKFFNTYLQSYGLRSIHFVTAGDIQKIIETTEHKAPELTEEKATEQKVMVEFSNAEKIERDIAQKMAAPIEESPIKRTRSPFWKYAAAAVLLPIAFYSYWIPMKTDVLSSGVVAFHDFNPFHKNTSIQYTEKKIVGNEIDTTEVRQVNVEELANQLPADVATLSYQYSEQVYIPVKLHDPKAANTPEKEVITENKMVPEVIKTEVSVPAISGQYYLIANCFGSEENALNYVKLLRSKGFDAKIVDKVNGLYRVSAGNAPDVQVIKPLEKQLEGLDVKGAWILKK